MAKWHSFDIYVEGCDECLRAIPMPRGALHITSHGEAVTLLAMPIVVA